MCLFSCDGLVLMCVCLVSFCVWCVFRLCCVLVVFGLFARVVCAVCVCFRVLCVMCVLFGCAVGLFVVGCVCFCW